MNCIGLKLIIIEKIFIRMRPDIIIFHELMLIWYVDWERSMLDLILTCIITLVSFEPIWLMHYTYQSNFFLEYYYDYMIFYNLLQTFLRLYWCIWQHKYDRGIRIITRWYTYFYMLFKPIYLVFSSYFSIIWA